MTFELTTVINYREWKYFICALGALAAMKDYAVKQSFFDIITRVKQNSLAKLFQLGIVLCFILVGSILPEFDYLRHLRLFTTLKHLSK